MGGERQRTPPKRQIFTGGEPRRNAKERDRRVLLGARLPLRREGLYGVTPAVDPMLAEQTRPAAHDPVCASILPGGGKASAFAVMSHAAQRSSTLPAAHGNSLAKRGYFGFFGRGEPKMSQPTETRPPMPAFVARPWTHFRTATQIQDGEHETVGAGMNDPGGTRAPEVLRPHGASRAP